MKNIIGILLILIGIYSCTSTKETTNSKEMVSTDTTKDTIRIVNEELEYELLIIDIGFDSWMVTQRSMNFYSQPNLEAKNNMYVIEWNSRVLHPNRYASLLYEQQIEYDSSIDYGKELNYKLYMYFQFFQQKYNQKLLAYGR